MRAAVLTAVDTPLVVRDDVEVEAPRAGEVGVRMVASGVCHSDRSMQDATLPVTLPVVLGHEGAGIIEAVGEGVRNLAVGDPVVVSWVPQCGRCYFCERGQRQLCQTADAVLLTAGLLDGTPRMSMDGAPLHQMLGTGTFAERTVVAATAAVKVPRDLELTTACLLGCAVLTGVGAALNTATIRPGDTVAVIGCGGVGLNIVQGARIAGAAEIVAIDTNPAKLALATSLGATTTVDASLVDAASVVRDLTAQRGADVAFEAIGAEPTIHQAVDLSRRGGEVVLVGIPSLDVVLSLPVMLGLVMAERTIRGCWYGSADISRDIPSMVELYRRGELLLDELVSRRTTLDDVNEALDGLATSDAARTIVVL